MSRSAEWLLRLEADAWLLCTRDAERRLVHSGVPALALDELAKGMRERGARLRVVLGDGWLRYLVLRWPQGVVSREERSAYMAHRFREVHQVAEPDWVLSMDRDVVAFPAFACAAPAPLIAALQLFAKVRGLQLGSITGDFVDRFNLLQRSFSEAPGCLGALAVARGARLSVGLWRDGAWQAVRSRMMGQDASAELQHMLDGWHAELAPAEAGVLYALGIVPAKSRDWRVMQLEA